MEIHVDREVCQNYGQCVFASPEVFDFNDDGELVYESSPSPAHDASVESAITVCPVQAITSTAP